MQHAVGCMAGHHRNHTGVVVSNLITQTVAQNCYLRHTLFHWKQQLRMHADVSYIGSHHGQVSTYALFTILYNHLNELNASADISIFEMNARRLVMRYLQFVPRMVRTPDLLSPTINLTSGSFLAKRMAAALENIPALGRQ